MTTQQVVRAYYVSPVSVFKIPKTINIEDTTVVKSYWVEYDKLYIEFVDTSKDVLVVEPGANYHAKNSFDIDFKNPEFLDVADASYDECISDDEEEEEYFDGEE